MTPEQRDKHLKTIAKIENLPRPEKWQAIKKFILELHPELVEVEKAHCDACKEIRQKSEPKTAKSKGGDARMTMKLFGPVYTAITKMDPELMIEMSGKNNGDQEIIGKQLYKAFPEYRIAREY